MFSLNLEFSSWDRHFRFHKYNYIYSKTIMELPRWLFSIHHVIEGTSSNSLHHNMIIADVTSLFFFKDGPRTSQLSIRQRRSGTGGSIQAQVNENKCIIIYSSSEQELKSKSNSTFAPTQPSPLRAQALQPVGYHHSLFLLNTKGISLNSYFHLSSKSKNSFWYRLEFRVLSMVAYFAFYYNS